MPHFISSRCDLNDVIELVVSLYWLINVVHHCSRGTISDLAAFKDIVCGDKNAIDGTVIFLFRIVEIIRKKPRTWLNDSSRLRKHVKYILAYYTLLLFIVQNFFGLWCITLYTLDRVLALNP